MWKMRTTVAVYELCNGKKDRGERRFQFWSIWARLKEVFESTYEVLHELAEERGLNVEDIYASENIDREFWGEDYEGTPREQVYQKLESDRKSVV